MDTNVVYTNADRDVFSRDFSSVLGEVVYQRVSDDRWEVSIPKTKADIVGSIPDDAQWVFVARLPEHSNEVIGIACSFAEIARLLEKLSWSYDTKRYYYGGIAGITITRYPIK